MEGFVRGAIWVLGVAFIIIGFLFGGDDFLKGEEDWDIGED